MNSMCLAALAVGMVARGTLGLSVAHVHQQTFRAAESDSESFLSERSYASLVKLGDDLTMAEFVKRILAAEDKFVPQDQEGELTGFVQWFDGTKAIQSFEQMRRELSEKSWVKDLNLVDGAKLSETDYQAVASRRNDTAMILLVNALLKTENKYVPEQEQDELAGFVPWFSGTKATQTLEQMRQELFVKPWVQDIKAVNVNGEESKAAFEQVNHTHVNATWETDKQNKTAEGTPLEESEEVADKSEEVANNLLQALSSESEEMESPPAAKCSDCIVWGEANILSFNAYRSRAKRHPSRSVELFARGDSADQFVVSEAGTYWLVNNDRLQIQGRYWKYNNTRPGLGLGAIAVSGPMVGNDTLVIRSLNGKVTWGAKEILRQLPSSFSNKFVKANYMSDVGPVAGDTHAPGIQFLFANGVTLTVGRYRHKLSARISVCETDAGAVPIEGQCGNLKEMPRHRAQVWLAAQRAATKLPFSKMTFPDHGKSQHNGP